MALERLKSPKYETLEFNLILGGVFMKYRELAIDILNGLSEEQIEAFVKQFLDENTIARMETEEIINNPNRKHYKNFDEIIKEIEGECEDE